MKRNWIAEAIASGEMPVEVAYHDTPAPGTQSLQALVSPLPFPIAVAWWRWLPSSDEIEILYAWTHESYRRLGVTGCILAELVESYPRARRIVTSDGSPLGAKAMKTLGWKQGRPGIDGTRPWHFTPKKGRAA